MIRNIDEMWEVATRLFGIASDEIKEDEEKIVWRREVSSWIGIRKCDVNKLKEIENEYAIAIWRDCDKNVLILEFRVYKEKQLGG